MKNNQNNLTNNNNRNSTPQPNSNSLDALNSYKVLILKHYKDNSDRQFFLVDDRTVGLGNSSLLLNNVIQNVSFNIYLPLIISFIVTR